MGWVLIALLAASCFPLWASAQPTGGGGRPAGDITAVGDCLAGACDKFRIEDGGGIYLGGADPTEAFEGLVPPIKATCDAILPQASMCFQSSTNEFIMGTGSGVITMPGGAGSGDITDVYNCASGDCNDIAATDGDRLDFSSVNPDTTTEGIIHPQGTDCSGATAEGQDCWETDAGVHWIGNGAAAVKIGPLTLDEAFDQGKTIDGANSRSNAVKIFDGNNDGHLFYTGVSGPTVECVTDYGGGSEATCDLTYNAAAGDSILLQQAGTTVVDIDNAGVATTLPTGDIFDVNLNSVDVLTIDEASGFDVTLPSGDTFSVTVNSVNIISADDTTVTVTGGVAASGEVTGLVRHDDDTAATVALSGADCRGGYHKNTDADAITYTLCDGETGGGQMACFADRAGGQITVDVNDVSETITLADGTAMSAGEAAVLASGIGNWICLFSDSATAWHVMSSNGTVTEETP